MKERIYLDNSQATKPSPEAISAMVPYLTDRWGAEMAPHRDGARLFPAIKEAMQSLYSLLQADEEQENLVITSSGAEAVNQVIFGVYHEVTRNLGKNQFVTSTMDEAPQIVAASRLEEYGCIAKMVSVNESGMVTRQALAESFSPRTALFSLSVGCGLTGVLQDLAPLADLCRERGVLLHLDVTHALGKVQFDWEKIDPDFVTFNGDQIHAPPGVGGLLIRKGKRMPPLILGGANQAGYRAGARNTAATVGAGVAADQMLGARDYLCTEVGRLRFVLETKLKEKIPGLQVLFQQESRLPHCTTLLLPGVVNELAAFALDREGISVSIGGGQQQQISYIVQAAGLSAEKSYTAISLSLSRYTTEQEIETAVTAIAEVACRYAAMSEAVQQEVTHGT